MREYTIYLPLKYNDGSNIEEEKLRAIKVELVEAFGAITVSSLNAPYQGRWKYGGVEYIDDITKIEIVATNDRLTRDFSLISKSTLRKLCNRLIF